MKLKKADIAMLVIIVLIILSGLLVIFTFGGNKKEVSPRGDSFVLTDTKEELFCTMEIRCDTVIERLEDLIPKKAEYIPQNGVILEKTKVSFQQGENVFEVLQRVCKEANIQLEYSYVPLYNSYYIEGINHLYEFDCGRQSGWMYQVNGIFPEYGSSSYKVEPGSEIVWYYTCQGLGADLED